MHTNIYILYLYGRRELKEGASLHYFDLFRGKIDYFMARKTAAREKGVAPLI